MKRRGYTIRGWSGRGIARVMIPSRRVRLGWERKSDRLVVSLGFVIVTFWGFA